MTPDRHTLDALAAILNRDQVPFAGHPNVGTAFLLARESRFEGAARTGTFVFEEAAGLVPIRLLRDGELTVGAELRAPEGLSRRTLVAGDTAAACLSLCPLDIATHRHAPQVVSVGLPFLIVELMTRDALTRSKPNLSAYEDLLPLDGADDASPSIDETVLHARMYSPLDGIVEDPATGSASAATAALLASLTPVDRRQQVWRIHQGVEMGRPSLLLARTVTADGTVLETHVGGHCVAVLEGSFVLGGAL